MKGKIQRHLIDAQTARMHEAVSDSVYVRGTEVASEGTLTAVLDELATRGDTNEVWSVVDMHEAKTGAYINSSNSVTSGNARIFVLPVSAGEKYRLIVNPGYGWVSGATFNVDLWRTYSTRDINNLGAAIQTGPKIKNVSSRQVMDITIANEATLLTYQGYYTPNGKIGDDQTAKNYSCTAFQLLKLTDVQHQRVRKPLKILAVGNSFTNDELSYFPFVLKSLYPDIELRMRLVVRGSASLAMYNNNRNAYSIDGVPIRAYDYHDEIGRWSAWYSNGAWSQWQNTSLYESVTAEDWDIIAFQEVSTSPFWSSVQTPLTELVQWLREECAYRGKIAWRMTHAYADDYSSYPTGSSDSDSMWALNRDLAKQVMASGLADMLMPAGTAVQNIRHSSLLTASIPNGFCQGNVDGALNRDIHLTEGIAPFATAASTVAAIMGNVISARVQLSSTWLIPGATTQTWSGYSGETLAQTLAKYGEDVSDSAQAIAVQCAMNAALKPYEITIIN